MTASHSCPVLSLSLLGVIVDLGMPLDYRSIVGAGLYTAIYILSRAIGKSAGRVSALKS